MSTVQGNYFILYFSYDYFLVLTLIVFGDVGCYQSLAVTVTIIRDFSGLSIECHSSSYIAG